MTIARDDGLTPVSSLGNCPETAIWEATVGYRADCLNAKSSEERVVY